MGVPRKSNANGEGRKVAGLRAQYENADGLTFEVADFDVDEGVIEARYTGGSVSETHQCQDEIRNRDYSYGRTNERSEQGFRFAARPSPRFPSATSAASRASFIGTWYEMELHRLKTDGSWSGKDSKADEKGDDYAEGKSKNSAGILRRKPRAPSLAPGSSCC